MKSIFIYYFLFLSLLYSFSQTKDIALNYEAEYEFSNKKNKDTLKISFDKKGLFFHTNSKDLAKELARSIYNASRKNPKESFIDIVYDVKKELAYINFKSKENNMFFKVDINDFIPRENSKKTEKDSIKEISLICEKTDRKISLNNKVFYFYKIHPDIEKDKPIYVAFDTSKPFDINKIFYSLVGKITSSSNEVLKPTNIQKGLILEVRDHNDRVLLKAVSIKEKRKKISINYSFKVE